jgi:3-hydroxybutyryl-CoA dehydratase
MISLTSVRGNPFEKERRMAIARLGIGDISAGDSFSFDALVSEKMVDDFAELTGDFSPLHMDDSFASQRGFERRVVHGALIGGLVSRLIGVHLPGMNCLLIDLNLRYPSPAYPNETVRVTGTVEQVSVPANAMSMKVTVLSVQRQSTVAKGKVSLAFTNER